jgi:hypothetical protein
VGRAMSELAAWLAFIILAAILLYGFGKWFFAP